MFEMFQSFFQSLSGTRERDGAVGAAPGTAPATTR